MWSICFMIIMSITFVNSRSCAEYKSCVDCVSQFSWTKRYCRWCQIDLSCHADGALVTNPCSSERQVTNASLCPNPFGRHQEYNETFAFHLLKFAGAAYQSEPTSCFQRNSEHVDIVAVERVKCDLFGNHCIGLVAVDSNEKMIILAFRGSSGLSQVAVQALNSLILPRRTHEIGGNVERYFLNAFEKLWKRLKPTVEKLSDEYPTFYLASTGHSLGGALAILSSATIAHNRLFEPEKIRLVTYGSPRVGDYKFAKQFAHTVPYSWRIVHRGDIVPHLPPCSHITPKSFCVGFLGGPYHIGWEVWYLSDMSLGGKWPINGFKLCTGPPFQEDESCSNSLEPAYVYEDHVYYFNKKVTDYCSATSQAPTTTDQGSSVSETTIAEKENSVERSITFESWYRQMEKRCKPPRCEAKSLFTTEYYFNVVPGSFDWGGAFGVDMELEIHCTTGFLHEVTKKIIRLHGTMYKKTLFVKTRETVNEILAMNVNFKSSLDAFFLQKVIIDMEFAKYAFTVNQWFNDRPKKTDLLLPDRSNKTAEYILSIKTGSAHWAGIKFLRQYGREAYVTLVGSNGRGGVNKLTRSVGGLPTNINPSSNSTISFDDLELGKIEEIKIFVTQSSDDYHVWDAWNIETMYLTVLQSSGDHSFYLFDMRHTLSWSYWHTYCKPLVAIYPEKKKLEHGADDDF